jgi:two-component system OmpR family sensor kinase
VLARVPIRLRLTLAFAILAAFVLVATSVFLLVRLRASLDKAIHESLLTRARDVAALVESGGPLARPADPEEEVAQVLLPDATIGNTTGLRRPLLTADELRRAGGAQVTVEQRYVDALDSPFRVIALPALTEDGPVVVVVGASLRDRDETLDALIRQLLIAAPVVLLLVSLGGYVLATAALRPVESMRAEAAAISGVELSRRLTLPPARDEISRLGQTLNEMLERLDSAVERERRFVADASHELRTPLAVLQAELELALRRPRPAEELEAAIRSAAEESERLSRLAQDLLALASADESGLPLRRTTVHADELLGRIAERYGPSGGELVRIEVESRAGTVLHGDPVRLEQALGNLVDNALRHGGDPVVLRAARDGDHVELHVLDAGPGFPTGFLGHAFERFSRADDARGRGGTGLGLAIVAAIAQAHGGTAQAANRSGGGADVWLSLPIR